MKAPFLLFVVLSTLAFGCASPTLERQEVPIHWGIRMDEETNRQALEPSFEYIGPNSSLLVEVPIAADSSGQPRISMQGLAGLAQLAKESQTPLTIALTTTYSTELFPEEEIRDIDSWFFSLENDIVGMMSGFAAWPPERLVLCNDWHPVNPETGAWVGLVEHLGARYKDLQLGYGWNGEGNPPEWAGKCDFLALEYPALADPNPKPRAMELNPTFGQVAMDLPLPLLIYRANLMGPYKTIALKNQLRFWPEELELQGIFINSLYPKVAPLDTTSYFGLHTSPDLLDFLEEYSK